MAINLINLLPVYFRDISEFKVIMEAEDWVLSDVESTITTISANMFIQTADEATLKLLENRFGIVTMPGEELDYRRERLLQKYNTITPYSFDFLRDRLTELYGDDYIMEVDPINLTLTISLTSPKYGAVNLLYSLLWDIVPAHIQIIANQEVSNYITQHLHADGAISATKIQTLS